MAEFQSRKTFFVFIAFAWRILALSDADPSLQNLVPAFRVESGQFVSNLSGISNSAQDIFERQACGQGYGQCGYTGECCPQDSKTCCGLYCLGRRDPGIKCCGGGSYLCPNLWDCCGTIGNHCSPSDGVCCTAQGGFCPKDWSCCGDQGHCYPTDGWHCCSNDGNFCPNGSKCVYCSSGSTQICCQGADGSLIPPYNTGLPGGGGGGTVPTSTAVPDKPTQAPTTAMPDTPTQAPTDATPETSDKPISTTKSIPSASNTETSTPESQYFSTTFTYTITIWTQITYIQSTVDHTIQTTSTTLSCLAISRAAALPTLSQLASSVQASADSSASAASPINSPTPTRTGTPNGAEKWGISLEWMTLGGILIFYFN